MLSEKRDRLLTVCKDKQSHGLCLLVRIAISINFSTCIVPNISHSPWRRFKIEYELALSCFCLSPAFFVFPWLMSSLLYSFYFMLCSFLPQLKCWLTLISNTLILTSDLNLSPVRCKWVLICVNLQLSRNKPQCRHLHGLSQFSDYRMVIRLQLHLQYLWFHSTYQSSYE